MNPFTLSASAELLADLDRRLGTTRWPPPGRLQRLEYLPRLIEYWRDHFDWRLHESRLNEVPQYRVKLDGVDLHFVYVRGKGPAPLPLMLTHGWPSSFYEYLQVLPQLTDPAGHGGDPDDSFDVIIPSLPGFGFSTLLNDEAGIRQAPLLLTRLATEVLGYQQFAAHGADIGAYVTNRIALEHHDAVVGIHVTQLAEPSLHAEGPALSDAERDFLDQRVRVHETEQAYAHVQRTRPHILAYGLQDSPVGLAAWITEKWRDWSDSGDDIFRRFTEDQLLTTVMLYWATNTIGSSMQAYADWALASAGSVGSTDLYPDAPAGADSTPLPPGRRIGVPAAIALTVGYDPPREWAERAYDDLRRWHRFPSGGHFIAMEEPELLASDLTDFFRPFRPTRG